MNSHRIIRYAVLAILIVMLAGLAWVYRSRSSHCPTEPVAERVEPAAPGPAVTRPTEPLPSTASVPNLPEIWKSETTGKEYRVQIDKDRFLAEWVNIPAQGAEHDTYIRSECRRVGSKWVGTTSTNLKCAVGGAKPVTNTCRLQFRMEILSIQADRITGRGESLRRFDCQTCRVDETGWGDFVWVPKTSR